jgi:hypothetical protein
MQALITAGVSALLFAALDAYKQLYTKKIG